MPAEDEAEAVAVVLPPPEAARVAVELWEAGQAVVPLDPAAPAPDLRRSLDALRPTALIDREGRHTLPGGVPVVAGVAAIVATSGTTGERKGVELTFSGLAASGAAVASALGRHTPTSGPAAPGASRPPAGASGVRVAPMAPSPGLPGASDTAGSPGRARSAGVGAAGMPTPAKPRASDVVAPSGGGTGGGWLCCLPVHMVAGLAVVGRAWATGMPLTVHPGFDPGAIEEAARQGAAFVSLVPTMLRRLIEAGPQALAAFEHILLGGGAIDPALLGRAREAGAMVSTTYGMTETWGGVVHNGHPLPGVEVRLDRPADGGETGEILLRTPTLMRGYRLWPEGTAAAVDPHGWYRTGDIGRIDPAPGGRLWVVDRLGDVVNTGGIKVIPTEVERVLARHPGVADVCVAGRPDADWGQRVVAYIVPAEPGSPPSLDDLRDFARDHLTAAKLPRELVLLRTIPRTPGGKPLRRLLPTPA